MRTFEIIGTVFLFCVALSVTAWLVTQFSNFVDVKFKIREKE